MSFLFKALGLFLQEVNIVLFFMVTGWAKKESSSLSTPVTTAVNTLQSDVSITRTLIYSTIFLPEQLFLV